MSAPFAHIAVFASTQTVTIVSVAALAISLIGLILVAVLGFKIKKLRSAQSTILGSHGSVDLVSHAAELHNAFEQLHIRVEETAERIEQRLQDVERRLDTAITHRALIRYDAYGELSGHQSATLALLDAHQNGLIISSIVNRQSARIYCKQIYRGKGEHELSPEESEAIARASIDNESSSLFA